MKEYWIETTPIRFHTIYEAKIDVGINRHGTAHIEGYIEDEWEENYVKQLTERAWVAVEAVGREGNREIIFCGMAASFMFTVKNGQRALAMELKSGTHLLDIEKHTRFFQDSSVTYADICHQLGASGGGQGAVRAEEANHEISMLIVQYGETDWQFLVRLLGGCGSFLVPDMRRQGIFYTVGMPRGKECELEEGKYSLEKDLEGYRKKRADGMEDISEADCLVCHIQLREIHSLGDIFHVLGLPMYVYELEIGYVQGELICHCKAGTARSMRAQRVLPETVAGISFEATIMEVQGDKVQLFIHGDEHEGKCGKRWFPFSTPYSTADGTGWYCMPERGDRVRLRFPDCEENNAYVMSAVHLPIENGERKNPAHKIWKNRQQKEIRLTPDSILITNNCGMKIEMVDGKGIQIESDKSIMIKAGSDINLVSDGAALMLAAETSLVMNQGGTSIQLEDGIRFMGGEFHVQ